MKMFCLLLLVAALPTALIAEDAVETKFYGHWDLAKDDDNPPDTPVDKERLTFYPDGTLTVSSLPVELTYTVQDGRLLVTAVVGGEAQVFMDRPYEIDEKSLRLKNDEKGFVHYLRSNDPLKPRVDTSTARTFADDKLKIDVPAGWQNFQDSAEGRDQYAFTSSGGQSMLQFVMTPAAAEMDPFSVTQAMAAEMQAKLPKENGPEINTIEDKGFYGLKGKAVQFKKVFPEGTILMTFHTARSDDLLVFMFAQEMISGESGESPIKTMLSSTEIKGRKLQF